MAKVLTQVEALRIASKAKTAGMKSPHFIIEVRGADLVVSLLNGKFKATYYKPLGRRNLILRERTKTDDEGAGGRSISGCGCQSARAGVDCVDKQKPRLQNAGASASVGALFCL